VTRKTFAVLVLVLCAGRAEAQGTASITPHHDPHPLSEYSGVTPGEGDRPPAERRIGRGRGRGRRPPAIVATWPGFQPGSGSGGSRFFVQTTAPIATSLSTSPGRVEILFPNARTHLSNTRRWLETEFFDTPVLRAHFERRGRQDLVLVFFLRNAIGGTSPVSATPTVTSGTDPSGYFFTYIDFPAGRWIEEPIAPPPSPAPAPTPRASEPGRPPPTRDPSLDGMDDERPPPVERGPTP
jgi:hypothetical protein